MGREERPSGELSSELGNSVEEALARIAEGLVPFELVSPPPPLYRLPDVEDLIHTLHIACRYSYTWIHPEFAMSPMTH